VRGRGEQGKPVLPTLSLSALYVGSSLSKTRIVNEAAIKG
jgi:hypothetical protein